MNNIVFLEPNCLDEIPFTTSKVVAENGKVDHDTVKRLIRNYKNDLKEFGVLGLEIRKPNAKGVDLKSNPLNTSVLNQRKRATRKSL